MTQLHWIATFSQGLNFVLFSGQKLHFASWNRCSQHVTMRNIIVDWRSLVPHQPDWEVFQDKIASMSSQPGWPESTARLIMLRGSLPY